MKKLSISQQFGLVVGLAILLVITVIFFASSEMKNLGRTSKESITAAVKPMTELAKTGIEVQRIRVNLRDYLLSSQIGQPAEKRTEFKQRYQKLATSVSNRVKILKSETQTPEESKLMEKINQEWDVLVKVVIDIEQAIDSNNGPLATEYMLTRCYSAANALSDTLYELDDLFETTTFKTLDAQLATAEKTTTTMLWIAAVGLVLFLGVVTGVWNMVQSLKESLVEAMQISERIAKGDLTARIEVRTQDEGGMLLKSLAEMLRGLRTTVSKRNRWRSKSGASQ